MTKEYRVHWGESSWDIEAVSEEDAISEIATGLAQRHPSLAHPVDESAYAELWAEEVEPD